MGKKIFVKVSNNEILEINIQSILLAQGPKEFPEIVIQ